MNPKQLVAYMVRQEVDGKRAPDCRRVIREAREDLAVSLREGNGAAIAQSAERARDILQMWEGH